MRNEPVFGMYKYNWRIKFLNNITDEISIIRIIVYTENGSSSGGLQLKNFIEDNSICEVKNAW